MDIGYNVGNMVARLFDLLSEKDQLFMELINRLRISDAHQQSMQLGMHRRDDHGQPWDADAALRLQGEYDKSIAALRIDLKEKQAEPEKARVDLINHLAL